MTANDNPVVNRPAESAGAAGSIALLIARAIGLKDADTIVALAAVIGFIPAAVTWTVHLWRSRNGRTGP